MVNTPIPTSLKSEAQKAARILKEFSIPSASSGPDKIIPAGLIENACGLAVLTVFKLGFLVTARGGSGIVIAKLKGGEWSAPSAIGIAGLGGGFEIGAEVTDFVIILYKQAAVDAFSKGGNLTLGGNFTIAAGPLGRNVEGDVAIRSPAAVYTYSKTKGLFAGISIEGSVLIERKDANRKFYGQDIRASSILSGEVERPGNCEELYDVLANHREMAERAAVAFAKKMAQQHGKTVVKSGLAAAQDSMAKRFHDSSDEETEERYSSHDKQVAMKPKARSASPEPRPSKSSITTVVRSMSVRTRSSATSSKTTKVVQQQTVQQRVVTGRSMFYGGSNFHSKKSSFTESGHSSSKSTSRSIQDQLSASSSSDVISAWDKPLKVRALWSYSPQMPCDLGFNEGDEIEVLTRTAVQEDWWEGKLHGKIGIFPANLTQLV